MLTTATDDIEQPVDLMLAWFDELDWNEWDPFGFDERDGEGNGLLNGVSREADAAGVFDTGETLIQGATLSVELSRLRQALDALAPHEAAVLKLRLGIGCAPCGTQAPAWRTGLPLGVVPIVEARARLSVRSHFERSLADAA